MPLHLRDIEDPYFDREAAAYEQLHRRPHPLLPLHTLRKAALAEGFVWEVRESQDLVSLTATVGGTRLGILVTLRTLIDSEADPDGSRTTAQVISALKRDVAKASGAGSTDALHAVAFRLLERTPRHTQQPTYDEWCSMRDEMQRAAWASRVRLDHDIAAMQRQTAPLATTPLCLVAERGDERLCIRWLDGRLVAHAA